MMFKNWRNRKIMHTHAAPHKQAWCTICNLFIIILANTTDCCYRIDANSCEYTKQDRKSSTVLQIKPNHVHTWTTRNYLENKMKFGNTVIKLEASSHWIEIELIYRMWWGTIFTESWCQFIVCVCVCVRRLIRTLFEIYIRFYSVLLRV